MRLILVKWKTVEILSIIHWIFFVLVFFLLASFVYPPYHSNLSCECAPQNIKRAHQQKRHPTNIIVVPHTAHTVHTVHRAIIRDRESVGGNTSRNFNAGHVYWRYVYFSWNKSKWMGRERRRKQKKKVEENFECADQQADNVCIRKNAKQTEPTNAGSRSGRPAIHSINGWRAFTKCNIISVDFMYTQQCCWWSFQWPKRSVCVLSAAGARPLQAQSQVRIVP